MIAKTTKWLSWLLCCCLCLGSYEATAQKNKKDKGGDGEPQCLKDLPKFFVDDAVFPAYLKQIYKEDATRLAIRMLNKEQRIAKQTVRVPEELVRAIYNALIAVRISDYGAIDTVAKTYYVRTFPVPSVNSVILLFEHDAEWAKPLQEKKDSTGSVEINRVIREFNLVMSKMVYLDEERKGLVLQSREPLNVPALMHKLYMDVGIGCVEENAPYGDGNDISIERTKENGWKIVYSVRFGNCLNQCPKFRNWEFNVSNGGEVTYVGSTGETIPPWVTAPAQAKKYPDVPKTK